MTPPDPRLVDGLEPLLRGLDAGGIGAIHLSLLGSARVRPLEAVGDVDLSVVVERMDRAVWDGLVAAAEAACAGLARATGHAWGLELRRGPFEPRPVDPADPAGARRGQLHLLVDDLTSLAALPEALVLHGAASGLHLGGERLDALRPLSPPGAASARERRRREALRELGRQQRGLCAREIPHRVWCFEPEPHLADATVSLDGPWQRVPFVRHLATTTDLFLAVLGGVEADAVPPLRPLVEAELSTVPSAALVDGRGGIDGADGADGVDGTRGLDDDAWSRLCARVRDELGRRRDRLRR